jgi:adenylylsulfate kinase
MNNRILIMGLPGSGKTTIAYILKKKLEEYNYIITWLNADDIRKKHNDWDFSREGRIRQSQRMRELADSEKCNFVIADFVAPLTEMRNNFKADWTIWMDTINQGRFEDTNQIFIKPDVYDFRITELNAEKWADFIASHILDSRRRPVFDYKKETVQMLGRWQPWHRGHRALFERAISKTGQVCIMIRDCQGWNETNPFSIEQVEYAIKKDLDPLYQGQYKIIVVPNITNITYGRNVGYIIEEELFDEDITQVSATNIRKELGLK